MTHSKSFAVANFGRFERAVVSCFVLFYIPLLSLSLLRMSHFCKAAFDSELARNPNNKANNENGKVNTSAAMTGDNSSAEK
jgi:hypothetical protein